MVLVLATAALIQVSFLPGYLVLRLVGMSQPLLATVVYSFGLSLIANYLIVSILVLIGWFNQPVVIAIFLCELAVAGWLLAPVLFRPIGQMALAGRADWFFVPVLDIATGRRSVADILRLCVEQIGSLLALAALVYASHLFISNIGSGFEEWDVVNVWSKWAEDWFHGKVPNARSYPQVLPTNWALIYQFIGSDLYQSFPKIHAGLFPLFILLTLLSTGFGERDRSYAYAICTTALLLANFRWFLASGHTDIPIAYFAILAVACICASLRAKAVSDKNKLLTLSLVFAVGSALLKQSGFFILLTYPMIAYWLTRPASAIFEWNTAARVFGSAALSFVVMLAPWYVPRVFTRENLELMAVAGVGIGPQEGLSLIKRLWLVINRDFNDQSLIIVAFACLVTKPVWREFLWFVAIPWLLLSAIFLGHDARNLALVFPIVGACAGFAIHRLLCAAAAAPVAPMGAWITSNLRKIGAWITSNLRKIGTWIRLALRKLSSVPLLWLFIAGTIAAFLLALPIRHFLSDSHLSRREIALQMRVGNHEVNQLLLDRYEKGKLDGKIVGNYMFLRSVPVLKNVFEFDHFLTIEDAEATIRHHNARYLIIMPTSNQSAVNFVVKSLDSRGLLKPVFNHNGYALYEIVGSSK